MYKWLRLIQVLQEKERSSAETEQNRQVIRGNITGQRHVCVIERLGSCVTLARAPSLQTLGIGEQI